MVWSFYSFVDPILNDSTNRNFLYNSLLVDPTVSLFSPLSVNYEDDYTIRIDFDYEIVTSIDISTLQMIVNVQFYGVPPDVFPPRNAVSTYSPDSAHGHDLDFIVGSFWTNTTTNQIFTCYDNTTSAAVWFTVPVISPATANGTTLQYSTDSNSWVNSPGNWSSLNISALVMFKEGTSDPSYSSVTSGLGTYLFSHGSTQELFFNCILPHNYNESTDITPLIHYIPTSANSGNVVWGIEYSWSNPGEVFPTPSVSTVITPTNSTAFEHIAADFTPLSGSGKLISSILSCKVYRYGTSVSDTYADDAGLLFVDFKFQQSGTGSNDPLTK